MQIVTDWKELQSSIKETSPFYQALFNFIFQGVEEPTEENYREHWMHSALIILDSLQDKAIISIEDRQTFINAFPDEYQQHITYLLKYPEFTEKFTSTHYISLAIWEDYGSGIFIVFDSVLANNSPVLQNLIEESILL